MAQQVTPALTVYKEFKPAKVYLTNGKMTRVLLANIFLKNSSLLYKSGLNTMEAKMNTISRVEFKDRTYYRIDSVLAYRVDTIGSDALYRLDRIDFEAFYQNRANNTQITSLDMGDMVGYTTTDLASEQDLHFPIIPVYYLQLDGRYILAQERYLSRKLKDKEKKRAMYDVITDKSFSWTDEQSLLRLLKAIR